MIQAASLEPLEKSMPSDHARAIVQAVGIELDARCKDLASKSDLEALRAETKADIKELRAATKADTDTLRAEISAEMKELHAEISKEVYETRLGLELRIQETRSEIVRWIFTVAMGQLAVMLGGVYFLFNLLMR